MVGRIRAPIRRGHRPRTECAGPTWKLASASRRILREVQGLSRLRLQPLYLLLLSLAVAVATPIYAWATHLETEIWLLEIAGYSGAALAFLTALGWDRHSRLKEEARQTESE